MEVASSTDRRRSRAVAVSAAKTAATPRGPSIIKFRGVSKRYPSGDLGLSHGQIVRDEATGLYARDETTREFARRMRSPVTRPPGAGLDPVESESATLSDRDS
jgi:hypothetical protein